MSKEELYGLRRLVDFLNEDGQHTAEQIAEHFILDVNHVLDDLHTLRKKGHIEYNSGGYYHVP